MTLYMDVISMQDYKEESTTSNRPKLFEEIITKQDVETVVNRALGPSIEIINYHLRIYSKDKYGYLGDHRHLVVTVHRNGSVEKEIHTFFAKTVPYDNEEQTTAIKECQAFFKETQFFKKIMPELMLGMKDKSWMAQCYLVKDDAFIFEDLTSRNFSVKGVHLDVPSLKLALSVLAKLHASSMLAEKRMGKSFYEFCPELLKESIFLHDCRFYDWIRTGIDVNVAVAKHLGLDHTRITEYCERIIEMCSLEANKDKKGNVICHGDAKSHNFMFNDSRALAILVDYQLVRYVPPMADVLQLVYLTTRRELRDKSEKEFLKHYHEVLSEMLMDNDEDIRVPTFFEILQQYEEMRLMGIVTRSLYAPIMLINTKLTYEMTKDSDGFANLLFGERVSLVFNMFDKDPIYKECIEEIIIEMVERAKDLL